MPNVQIRDVPEDVHRRLKAKAALAGRSLNDFLLGELEHLSTVATIHEIAEEIRNDPDLPRVRSDGMSTAEIIREGREERDRQLERAHDRQLERAHDRQLERARDRR